LRVGGGRPQGTIASVYAYELRWRRLPDLPTTTPRPWRRRAPRPRLRRRGWAAAGP